MAAIRARARSSCRLLQFYSWLNRTDGESAPSSVLQAPPGSSRSIRERDAVPRSPSGRASGAGASEKKKRGLESRIAVIWAARRGWGGLLAAQEEEGQSDPWPDSESSFVDRWQWQSLSDRLHRLYTRGKGCAVCRVVCGLDEELSLPRHWAHAVTQQLAKRQRRAQCGPEPEPARTCSPSVHIKYEIIRTFCI